MQKIETESQYEQVMARIEVFLQKATHNGGFEALNPEEVKELEKLSLLAEDYENNVLLIPLRLEGAKTISDMIRLKMFELKLKQKDLAKKLEVSETSLSAILNGKRRITIDFAKKLYTILQIDPAFILQAA